MIDMIVKKLFLNNFFLKDLFYTFYALFIFLFTMVGFFVGYFLINLPCAFFCLLSVLRAIKAKKGWILYGFGVAVKLYYTTSLWVYIPKKEFFGIYDYICEETVGILILLLA